MLDLDIRKQLGDFRLDARLQAPAGITVLFGASGSGKTSLINAVAGLLNPDDGRITLNGQVLFDRGTNVPAHKRRIGYVFQDARLFPHMSVLQNLRYGGRKDEDRVIDLLGLRELLNRKPKDLSGGEKQRTALGRALMRGPDILLMDEPLAALDSKLKAEILPYFKELRDEADLPILYVTHAMSEVTQLATTLALVQNGTITRAGPVENVLSDPAAVPLIGVRDAGAVLDVTVTEVDATDQLTTLAFTGGTLILPGELGAPGTSLRLRIAAQDVILSRARPSGLSALNILPTTITKLTKGRGPGVAVGLDCGGTALLARVTGRSARDMDLKVGAEVFAILKATSVAPRDVATR